MNKIIKIRTANVDDADTVAAIHTASRRLTYLGIYSDAYMAGPIEIETRASWSQRLGASSDLVVLLAEEDGEAIGFIAWVPDQDPAFGGLVDNFHMLPHAKGQGTGRKLFQAIRATAAHRRPGQPIFLWVYESNELARGAYARFGGEEDERIEKPTPDGKLVTAIRVTWPAFLVEGNDGRLPLGDN